MFRAGTLSRLKRPSLFRSCRREASSKTQGLSEDASHHAREHKTPTEGTAHGIHRPIPENQRFRHSGFFTLSLKGCCLSPKKFSDRPLFQKGSPGAGREALQETPGAGQEPCKKRPERGCRMGSPAKEKNSCERMDKRRRHGSRKRKASPAFF